MGLVYKHSRWIPHSLTEEQKLERVRQATALAELLEKSKKVGYVNIVTGDESWFTCTCAIKGSWVCPEDDNPEFDASKICVEKVMLTVIWGVKGMHVINFLPKDQNLNSEYFIENILKPLHEQKERIWGETNRKKLILHLDNCKVHNSKVTTKKYDEYGFRRSPHPPYSPDIAPSDFFLFGYTKEKLKSYHCKNLYDLQEATIQILNGISRKTLVSVFDEWLHRCYWVASNDGNYYHK